MSKHETWNELFFDLVFVLLMAQIAELLISDLTLRRCVKAWSVFIIAWTIWLQNVLYVNMTNLSESMGNRILMWMQMVFLCAAAASATYAFDDNDIPWFIIAVTGSDLTLTLQYARHSYLYIETRNRTLPTFWTMLIASVITASAAFLPVDYWLPVVLTSHSLMWVWRVRCPTPVRHISHIHKRLGLYTIIMLGEAVAPVVHVWQSEFSPESDDGEEGGHSLLRYLKPESYRLLLSSTTSEHEHTAEVVIGGIFAFTICYCFWWVYFDAFRYYKPVFHVLYIIDREENSNWIFTAERSWVICHPLLLTFVAFSGVGMTLSLSDIQQGEFDESVV
eukprot:Rmarinus@m.264